MVMMKMPTTKTPCVRVCACTRRRAAPSRFALTGGSRTAAEYRESNGSRSRICSILSTMPDLSYRMSVCVYFDDSSIPIPFLRFALSVGLPSAARPLAARR